MTRREWIILCGAVLIAITALWPTPSAPPEAVTRVITHIDSLKSTKPAEERVLADLRQQRRTALAMARTAQDSADMERARANTLDSVARATEGSAAQWQAAAAARAAEALGLRQVNGQLRVALVTDSATIFTLQTRLDKTEAVLDSARSVIVTHNDCRIIGPIKCPSRRQSFFAGVLVGGTVTAGVRLSF